MTTVADESDQRSRHLLAARNRQIEDSMVHPHTSTPKTTGGPRARLSRRAGFCVVCVALALSVVSCGNASPTTSASPSSSSSAAASPPRVTGSPTSTSTQTTSGRPQSSVPQLVVCAGGNFYAVPPGSSDTVTTPFAYGPTGTFSFANSEGSCGDNSDISPAPDFSKWAATSQTSDGSTVAGYVAANSDTFTDLSGHTSSYSGATVTDRNPMFSPTGELWWTVQTGYDYGDDSTVPTDLWQASVSGSGAEKWGSSEGDIGGFTPTGDPSPYPIFPSPSGKVLMFASFDMDSGSIQYIADANQVSGKCLEKAANGFYSLAYSVSKTCPGVADTSNLGRNSPLNVCGFAGMISDSAFVCLNTSGSSTYYESIPFTLSGTHIEIGRPTQLTPPTELSVADLGVSPDGQTLWYEVNQNDGSRTLYEVPTSGYSANPESYSPEISAGGQPTTIDQLSPEGWLWNGKYIPLQPSIIYEG
jgi:hypothetical protein